MKVTIEPDAVALIRGKGGHLILFQARATGCCGIGSALIPMVEIGKPRKPTEAYSVIEQDGVKIHVDRALDEAGANYRIQLTRFLRRPSITVSMQEVVTRDQ